MLRRKFLELLGLGAAVSAVLPKGSVNWKLIDEHPNFVAKFPGGARLIRFRQRVKFSETDIVAAELERVHDKIATLFDRDDVFFKEISR